MPNGENRDGENNIMKQQCPKFGNWVEGIEVSEPYVSNDTREGMKSVAGIAAKVGATLELIPEGRLVGGLLKGAIDLFADNVTKNSLKFSCSCGEVWIAPLGSGYTEQEIKDFTLFKQAWNFFFENGDEICSSTEKVDAFLSEWESKEMVSPLPKSELNFLLAFCAYCAIEMDKGYIYISRKYINKALHEFNDSEYHLFAELLNNKESTRNTSLIVPNAIKLLDELKEEQALLKQEWYWGQLQDAINEEVHKYKDEKIQEKKSYLIKNTLFAVPILLYVIYKYINYDIPDGFWSTLFSWIPIYWLILFTLGIPYLVVIADCYGVFSRKNEEWQELFIQQYTSFKWSDLLK